MDGLDGCDHKRRGLGLGFLELLSLKSENKFLIGPSASQIPSTRFTKGEKIAIRPLTLPSPARVEGKHVETRKKVPPP
jgi:hypothetical protein